VVGGTRLHAASTTSSASAGQARNDDVEEGDDGVDDSGADGADGVDDGHEAVADRAEDGFNARNYGTHIGGCVVLIWVVE